MSLSLSWHDTIFLRKDNYIHEIDNLEDIVQFSFVHQNAKRDIPSILDTGVSTKSQDVTLPSLFRDQMRSIFHTDEVH